MTWQLIVCALALLVAGPARGTPGARQGGSRIDPLPPVPRHLMFVPRDVAERMLDLAQLTRSDVVYDLGCGNGRLSILAAQKYGARSVGVDTDPKRIAEANANAEKARVSNRVRFVRQGAIDLSQATVVTGNGGLLQPLLTGRLKAGARIVTNFVAGSMKDWKPDRVDRFLDPRGKPRAILYLWTVPGRAPRPGTE